MNKRRVAFGAIFFILLIPIAVFLILSSRQVSAQADGGEGEREMIIAVQKVENGESFGGEVRVRYEDPAELPPQAEQASGLFLGQAGDTLTLGSGSIQVEVSVEVINDDDPVRTVNASHSGEEIEVRFDENTVFLEDTTPRPNVTAEDVEAGEMTVLRTVTAGSADALGENMLVRVWGNWQDDVLQAELVVYEPIS